MRVPPQDGENIIKMYIIEDQELDNKRAKLLHVVGQQQ